MAHIKSSRVTKKTKPSHRRRRHRHRYSSDSDSEDASRVSFLHHEDDTKLFLTLHESYRAVSIKYFKQIFFGTFRPIDSLKLSATYINRPSDNDESEASDLSQLLRSFEVYGQAICHYAQSNVAVALQKALSDYRIRLYELSVYYSFEYIREYHYSFMAARILNGQDDPVAWAAEDRPCMGLLVRKDMQYLVSSRPTQSFNSEGPGHTQFEDDRIDSQSDD